MKYKASRKSKDCPKIKGWNMLFGKSQVNTYHKKNTTFSTVLSLTFYLILMATQKGKQNCY